MTLKQKKTLIKLNNALSASLSFCFLCNFCISCVLVSVSTHILGLCLCHGLDLCSPNYLSLQHCQHLILRLKVGQYLCFSLRLSPI